MNIAHVLKKHPLPWRVVYPANNVYNIPVWWEVSDSNNRIVFDDGSQGREYLPTMSPDVRDAILELVAEHAKSAQQQRP